MMRYCTNTECRGDCETCNRAPVENPPLPRQFLADDAALEASMMRVRNGAGAQEDAQRLLCALQCASSQVLQDCEERFGLLS
jgi:hypothetical protein